MNNYIQVEGHDHLVRDPVSGAIINTDKSAYRAAVAAADKRKRDAEKLDSAVDDINNLKEEIGEIKDLLKELIQRV